MVVKMGGRGDRAEEAKKYEPDNPKCHAATAVWR